MKQVLFLLSIVLMCHTACSEKNVTQVFSPDKSITLGIGTEDGKLFYTVTKDGQAVLAKSFLGFKLADAELGENVSIKEVIHSSFNESWDQVWGEEITIHNNYNQMVVNVLDAGKVSREFNLVFRIFDDGIGFRYEFPDQSTLPDFTILDELTEFNLVENHTSWSIKYDTEFYEGLYRKMPINQLDTVSTPLTMETQNGLFLSIHEANLTDYAAMNLAPEKGSSKLKTYLTPWSTGEKVFVTSTRVSPWRTMIIAKSAGELLESRLMLNLNEPCKIADTSWIEPSRYIGIWWGMHNGTFTWSQGPKHGATTANTKRYIDFAAKHRFAGVLVEGWNWGWDADWTKEGDKFSFTKAFPDYDLKALAEYAQSKNVRLIGHHETGGASINYESQLDDAFALCQAMGINSVKTGYVSAWLDGKEKHSSQYGVRHYRKVVETAAKYKVMIDNHEPVMPTGLQRTYPNLMTQEGVRGQEYNAFDAAGGNPTDHVTIIPFTRGLAGPMDYTPGIFNYKNEVHPNTHPHHTRAKELALSVILFSPLQMASDLIENYEGFQEFEFITSCPTTWAKTVVPEATIGESLTIARKDRASDNWFVGSITNEPRSLSLSLSFLDNDSQYEAKIFKDGKDADHRTNPYQIAIETMEVTSKTVLDISQVSGGGAAIIIRKK